MFTDFKSPGIKPRFCELNTMPLTLLGKCYQTDTRLIKSFFARKCSDEMKDFTAKLSFMLVQLKKRYIKKRPKSSVQGTELN